VADAGAGIGPEPPDRPRKAWPKSLNPEAKLLAVSLLTSLMSLSSCEDTSAVADRPSFTLESNTLALAEPPALPVESAGLASRLSASCCGPALLPSLPRRPAKLFPSFFSLSCKLFDSLATLRASDFITFPADSPSFEAFLESFAAQPETPDLLFDG